MLAALERHPGVRLGLHYTGPLLEWLRARATRRPSTRLAALIDRGQVEIVGGGYYEPVLASLPERDRIGQLRRMADELERHVRASGRAAPGSRSASGSRTCPPRSCDAGYEWTILDDAHFRAAAHPRGAALGRLLHRRPGPPADGLRHRAGPALPDPVPAPWRRSSSYLREHATDDGRAAGDDGRRRREVRGLADHLGALLGARALGGPVLRRARGERRLADHDHPLGVAGAAAARSGGSTCPRARTPRWASGRCRPTRACASPRSLHAGPRRGPARGALDARRLLAQLPGQVPRDQRPPQADAPRVRGGRRRMAPRARPGRGTRPPLPGPVERLLLARPVRRHLPRAHAAGDARSTSSPPRTLADRGRRAGRTGMASAADLDLDGVDEMLVTEPGQVVAIKPTEGGGIGAWDVRAARHALTSVLRRRPEAYHAKLVALRVRAEHRGRTPGRGRGRPRRSTTSSRSASRGSRSASRTTATSGDRGWCTCCRVDTTPEAFARPRPTSCDDFWPGRFESRPRPRSAIELTREVTDGESAGRVVKRIGSRATAAPRRAIVGGQASPTGATAPLEALLGRGVGAQHAGRWRQPGRVARAPAGERVRIRRARGGGRRTTVRVRQRLRRRRGATEPATPAADTGGPRSTRCRMSEDGFERTHQGSAILAGRMVRLEPRASASMRLELAIDDDARSRGGGRAGPTQPDRRRGREPMRTRIPA